MPSRIASLFNFARRVMKRSATEASPSPFRTLKVPRLSQRTMDAKDGVRAAQGDLLLKPKEVDLKNLLNLIAKRIDESKEFSEPVVLRWAGGWVRDRLLGIPSNDIDVAINNMTGLDFIQRSVAIIHTERAKPTEEIPDFLRGDEEPLAGEFTVARNPEKSKHLETSSCKIWKQDIDFVNLRKETYTEDSRNPQMEFGTAEEDAERRDATINAMFYNITHDVVEDFTGGKEDLEKGLIRTPLEPLKTFTDDPLRVLRLIRFASRYNFRIEEETQRYMKDQSVLDALRVKISRDRVGEELRKMLKDKRPEIALQWIHDLDLYHAIFTIPSIDNPPRPDITQWLQGVDRLKYLIQSKEAGSIGTRLIGNNDRLERLAWHLAALLPWTRVLQGATRPSWLVKAKKSLVAHVAYEGFRAPSAEQTLLTAANEELDDIVELKQAVVTGEAWINDRGVVGMKLRRWQEKSGCKWPAEKCKWHEKGDCELQEEPGCQCWQLCVLNALLVETMEASNGEQTQQKLLHEWTMLLDHLDTLDWKAILSQERVKGPQLLEALGLKKAGKWMRPALDVCLQWQLQHPGTDDIAGAFDEVRARRAELGIPEA